MIVAELKPVGISINISSTCVTTGFENQIARDAVNLVPYDGEYEVIPSESDQILRTRGKRMTKNITISPIPSNYGKIEYNGAVLTVS